MRRAMHYGRYEHYGRYGLAVVLWALLAAGIASAQSPSGLFGIVVDELGAIVPGARITLLARDGVRNTAVCDGKGEFALPDVRPGLYSLIVEFAGFETWLDNAVRAPQQSPLRIVLKVAAVAIETEVKADDGSLSMEPDQASSAIVLDEKFIETLPESEDELRDYLEMMAGPGAGGASGGQGGAQFIVDGFRNGRLPPKEAILKITINQNPFSAEYSRPGAGRVEILTKPGNNEWRGGGGFSIANAALNARNAFALVRPDLDQKRYSFSLSGPIIHKKMSFFLNVERRGLTGGSIARAQTIDGLFVANVPALNNGSQFSLRVDYLLNQRNTLNVSYNRNRTRIENREFSVRGGGAASFILPERGSDGENDSHTLRIGETFVVNGQLLHESRLQAQYETRKATARTAGRAINVLDAFQGGGATCCPSDAREFNLEWQDYLTWTRKAHTIKTGLQLAYNRSRDLSLANFNGTFTFSSLDQYRRVLNGERVDSNDPDSAFARPTQFTMSQGNPLVRYGRAEGSWFVQDDWRRSPRLTISYGLRHELQTQLPDKLNFAPRVGVAWSPFRGRRTVIRAGAGIFYDRLTARIYETVLHFDGVRQQSLVIRNPSWPDPLAGSPVIDAQRTIRRTLDPGMKAPYVLDFNAGIERQLTKSLFASLSYTWTRGLHQFRARNINAPSPLTNARPDPTQGNLFQTETSAQSKHQRLWLRLDRRFNPRLSLFSSYTLSRTNSDADSAFALPADNQDLRLEWSRAATDRRHLLYFGGNVSLPWRLRFSPYVNIGSGLPFNITTGQDENRDTVLNDRPAGIRRNAPLPAALYSQLPDRCLLGCRTGGAPVSLREFLTRTYPDGVRAEGPGLFNVNLSMSKSFGLGKETAKSPAPKGDKPSKDRVARPGKAKAGKGGGTAGGEGARYGLTISAQITNLFNHVNFGQYSGVLTSPFFGRANSAQPARQIELSLRFSF
ncbi:MAG: carboxypeptidase regulatory-like domain-containing protein [Blastocatellia bacterium]|nr:carboxypeptidase regulatory-like domain-containing protein [Blastocatellia bacterium]